MSRILKILLGLVSLVIALIIVAVVVLPFVITANDFKAEIQSFVKDQLGRELTIQGDLELSVFPWVGLSTGRLTLSNPAKFGSQPFAEIASSDIKVKLVPLLSGQVKVNRVVLKGLSLHLIKTKQGETNWEDLNQANRATQPQPLSEHQSSALSWAALVIDGVVIEQAHVIWDDQQQGQTIEINDFNFKTGKLAFGDPIDLELSFAVSRTEPEIITESVQLSTQLVVNQAVNQIRLHRLAIHSLTTGDTIPNHRLELSLQSDIAVDLSQQTLTVTELAIKSNNLVINGQMNAQDILQKPHFKGSININSFNLVKLMQTMAIDLPPMQATDALNQVAMNFAWSGTTDSMTISNLLIKLDKSQLKGSFSVEHFSQPAIRFNLNLDTIDVDRYLAPALELETSSAHTPPVPASIVASSALLPVQTLQSLNAQGQLSIDQLTVKKLTMQGIKLVLTAQQGKIDLKQTIDQLYQGHYQGRTSINVRSNQPVIALTEKITQVKIQPLLNDLMGQARITGTFNASAQLKTSGNTQQTLTSGLNGRMAFNFKNGVVKGFNLQKIIDYSRTLTEGRALPTNHKNDQTVFSVIKGTALIKHGLISNHDLYAEASKLRVNGQGTADLVSRQLDYKIKAKLLKQVATAFQPEKIKGLPLIINIGGHFAEPHYKINIAQMLLEKNRAKLNQKKRQLLKKLDEKTVPGVGRFIEGFF